MIFLIIPIIPLVFYYLQHPPGHLHLRRNLHHHSHIALLVGIFLQKLYNRVALYIHYVHHTIFKLNLTPLIFMLKGLKFELQNIFFHYLIGSSIYIANKKKYFTLFFLSFFFPILFKEVFQEIIQFILSSFFFIELAYHLLKKIVFLLFAYHLFFPWFLLFIFHLYNR